MHTTFVADRPPPPAVLSSTNPNLQNVPIRTDLGRQIRRAFVPGSDDQVLLVLDYSQIELRILAHLSGDEGRARRSRAARTSTRPAARVFGLPLDADRSAVAFEGEDGELRPRLRNERMGLAQRLDIAPDEAREIMDAYFASFPAIREYLDNQVGHATVEGSPDAPPGAGATSRSCRQRTLACATWGAGRR